MKKSLTTEQKLRKIIRKEITALSEGTSELKERQRGLYEEFNQVLDSFLEWCATSSADIQMPDKTFYAITIRADKMLKELVAEISKIY